MECDFGRQSRLAVPELEVDNAMVEIHFRLPHIDAQGLTIEWHSAPLAQIDYSPG